MTRPNKWTWKTWVAILVPFFGLGTWQGAKTFGQSVVGWFALPTVQATQREGLDSVRIMLARFRFADSIEAAAIKTTVDSMNARQKYVIRVLRKMPQAKAAAREIEKEDREQEGFFGRRGFAALKGDRTP